MATKKRKRRPNTSISLWRDKVWKQFSLYIRLRDRLKENGLPTQTAKCITCEAESEWKSLQAGHFVPGRHPNILFKEKNCHAQCYSCNVKKHGNLIEYWPVMEKRYGKRTINHLRKLSKQEKHFTLKELQKLHKKYTKKVEELLAS